MFRNDFPVFTTHPDLVYLDSASSAQKPRAVIDAMQTMMEGKYANIHRGSYDLSEMAEEIFESSKEYVRKAIGAQSRHEIVYTYNATYAANLLARSLVKSGLLVKWDRILLSLLDHHANIVPWQIIAEEYGIEIDWIGVTEDGRIDSSDLERKITGAKLVTLTAASNVTGAVTDFATIRDIIARHCDEGSNPGTSWDSGSPRFARDDRKQKPFLIVDASQALPHFSLDVVSSGIDFLFATGHKVFADTGIGMLYGRKDLLQKMLPALCWGGAINAVSTTWYEPAWLPYRYEPGTPHIIGAASLVAAFQYIESVGGYSVIEKYEKELTEYALEKIRLLPSGVRLIGPTESDYRVWVFSFAFDHHHPRDVADTLADAGICVRAGHHCTEPLHTSLGLPATLRMSLSIYNTREDVDKFMKALWDI